MVPLVPILGVDHLLRHDGLRSRRDTWIRLVVWMALGIVIYFVYSRHHSKVGQSRGRVTALRIILGAASAVSRGRRFAYTPE